MEQIVSLLIPLLGQIVPGASAPIVEKVIQLLAALVPILIREYKDLLPIVQNVITALQQSGDITVAQWDALDAMSTQIDAEFRAALATAEAQEANK